MNGQRGMTLIEVMMAVFILGFAILSILGIMAGATRYTQSTILQDKAVTIARAVDNYLSSWDLSETAYDELDASNPVDVPVEILPADIPENLLPGRSRHSLVDKEDGFPMLWHVAISKRGIGLYSYEMTIWTEKDRVQGSGPSALTEELVSSFGGVLRRLPP